MKSEEKVMAKKQYVEASMVVSDVDMEQRMLIGSVADITTTGLGDEPESPEEILKLINDPTSILEAW